MQSKVQKAGYPEFFPAHIFVVDFSKEAIPDLKGPVQTHVINYLRKNQCNVTEFNLSDFKRGLFYNREACVWITGFSTLTKELIERYPQHIPVGTVIMVCNGVFGLPSFYSVKMSGGNWLHHDVEKILDSSLPHISPLKSRRLILNNPFNWHRPNCPAPLIDYLIKGIYTEYISDIIIVCATEEQKASLTRDGYQYFNQLPMQLKNKMRILGPNEIRLRTTLAPDDLVVAEGVGVLADCLASGAVGVQILNPHIEDKWQIDIYRHLLGSAQSTDITLIEKCRNLTLNFDVIKRIINSCFSKDECSKFHFNQYRDLFYRHRQLLISRPGDVMEDIMLEDYQHKADNLSLRF